MSRIFPHPILSLGLAVMWILLNSSMAPGTLFLAALIGLIVPFSMKRLEPVNPGFRVNLALFKLSAYVIQDIVRSNYAVSTIILGERRPERVSDFIHVPLDLKNRYALAVMAIIVTSTPGTLWVQYDSAKGDLLLHVLDLVDEEEWITLIKTRYERLLMEIFP